MRHTFLKCRQLHAKPRIVKVAIVLFLPNRSCFALIFHNIPSGARIWMTANYLNSEVSFLWNICNHQNIKFQPKRRYATPNALQIWFLKIQQLQIILLCVLSLVPWPGPSIFKISCPRDDARTVRKVVQSKWVPVLEKYGVSVPLECPFHPTRDIYGPQEKVKHQHRSSQWTCGLCGKSFFEERYLDMHFDNRHNSYTNMVGICVLSTIPFCFFAE